MKVSLGDKVKDRVTGFVGIVTSRSEYISGCARCGVQAEAKGNEQKEPAWIDELQLVIVKAGVVKVGPQNTGGPRPDAVRQNPR